MLERITKRDFATLGIPLGGEDDTVKRLEARILNLVIEETQLTARVKALGELRGCLEEFVDHCKKGLTLIGE